MPVKLKDTEEKHKQHCATHTARCNHSEQHGQMSSEDADGGAGV